MTKRFEGTAIGIDLGTTYSCVAAWCDGRIKIIRNEEDNKITPSCVAWDGTHLLVGELAKNQIATNPKNTVYDIKRLIGKRFSDVRVDSDIKSWPFKVIEDSGDKPMVVFEDESIVKKFLAEEISSMILKRLKDAAEAFIGTRVTHAVITVPAYFSDQQRQATKDAGKLAGLNVMRLISEPTSAAISYCFDKMGDKNGPRDKNVLIFDMGGGTFDVSLLNISKSGNITVKAVGGDTHMGGEDFVKVMMDYCVNLFMKKEKDISKNAKAMARLKEACEKAKRALSGTTITTIEIESLHEEIDFSMKFCRPKFEELNAGIFKKCIEHVESCLRDGNMHKNNVDDVVIVGGSTRIPKIQQMLMDFFDGKPLCKSVKVDAAVAHGAAVLAANLTGNGSEMIQNFMLADVIPLSLGIGVRTNGMSVVIPRNTPIPTMKECDYYTRDDNQVSAEIRVYECEEREIHKNIFLDKFILHDIPPNPAGEQKINVCFNIDCDGILCVSDEVTSTGNKKSIRIDKGSNMSKNMT